jgi:hypothetical protein
LVIGERPMPPPPKLSGMPPATRPSSQVFCSRSSGSQLLVAGARDLAHFADGELVTIWRISLLFRRSERDHAMSPRSTLWNLGLVKVPGDRTAASVLGEPAVGGCLRCPSDDREQRSRASAV